METVKKELFDSYDGKGIAAQYSRYAERVSKDIKGNDLELTVSAGRVTQVGGKPVGVDAYTKTETGTLLDGKADKAVPGAAGNLAALNGTGNLADSGIPGGTAAEGTSSLVITNTTANNATTTTYGWGAWGEGEFDIPIEPNVTVIAGRKYKTVTIGDQTWLAENLCYEFDNLVIDTENTPSGATEYHACYYNYDKSTYESNGLYYSWYALNYLNSNRATLIPGWHVPSKTEWETLFDEVGGQNIAGTKLKSTEMWPDGKKGDGTTGFNLMPYGNMPLSSTTGDYGTFTYIWLFPSYNNEQYKAPVLLFKNASAEIYSTTELYNKTTIRLIKDAVTA